MHDLASITTTFPKFWRKVREQQSSKLLMECLIYQQQSSLLLNDSERVITSVITAEICILRDPAKFLPM